MFDENASKSLAQKAIILLELAEKFEAEQNWHKAVQTYSEAADLLKKSGLLSHRIDDIYGRMTYLNQLIQQEKLHQRHQSEAQFASLQDQAFQILDQANELEKKGQFQDAISQYMSAISLLAQVGWDESQLGNIKLKLEKLASLIQHQQVPIPAVGGVAREEKAFGAPIVAMQSTALDKKSKARLEFEAKRKQEDDYQNRAFESIDLAKDLLKQKQFVEAKTKYLEAIKFLKTIGWTAPNLAQLFADIDSIEKQRIAFEKGAAAKVTPATQSMPQIIERPSQAQEQLSLTSKAVLDYEAKKQQETMTQEKAFNLMNEGEKLAKNMQFDEAMETYGIAAQLLQSIGWADQLVHIKTIIDKINTDKINFERLKAQKVKTQGDISMISQPEVSAEVKAEIKTKEGQLRAFEEKKLHEEETQKRAFKMIDIAKQLEREKQYNEAIDSFDGAISLLKSIGWHAYIQPIEKFITDIQARQARVLKAQELQQSRELEYSKFQDLIKEREKTSVKDDVKDWAVKRKEIAESQKIERVKQDKAFKLMNEADEFVKVGNYENAISNYLRAGELFKEIGWTDQIATVQIIIKTVQEKHKEFLDRDKKTLEIQEQRVKEEEEFRNVIAEEIRQEKEKIKEKRVIVRELKKEQEYLEKRKNEAFKILDEAESLTLGGNFDAAIEKYHAASIILAEIQWTEELNLIQNSIKELEKKKKERELLKYKSSEEQLKREKEDKVFQEKIAGELRKEREKLKEKEITLRAYEQEVEYREKRKEEAFKILDDAEKLTTSGDFDSAIEKYHAASLIFAEIQWKEELRLIQIAIQELEIKKREIELWKDRAKEIALKKEKEEGEFQKLVTEELNKEREVLLAKQVAVREYEKEVEYREKRKAEAFKILDDAEKITISGNFDAAIEKYHIASTIFAEIQWTEELTIIQNAIKELEKKKKEKEIWKQKAREQVFQKEKEAREYQELMAKSKQGREEKVKMAQYLAAQQKALSEENLKRQNEALKTLEIADGHIKKGKVDESIEIYGAAIKIFNEIGWEGPYLKVIQDTLDNLNKRKIKLDVIREKQMEQEVLREIEEKEFQSRIAASLEQEKEKMQAKKIAFETQEHVTAIREKRREEAFNILDLAESLTAEGNFEDAIAMYREADIILTEIQFPSNVVKEMMRKIQIKQKEQMEAEERESEFQIRMEMEEHDFQKDISTQMEIEKQKMKAKKIRVETIEKMQATREGRREEAFEVLNDAERLTKSSNFDLAIETYRNAALILSEIQYPVDSIHETIKKVQMKKVEQERLRQIEVQEAARRTQEERQLQEHIAQQIQQEKEKMKQKIFAMRTQEEIQTAREERKGAAFKVLDKAEKHVKVGDFDLAIETYRNAVLILSEIQFPVDSIHETIKKVQMKKVEKDQLKQRELDALIKKEKEEGELREIVEERKHQEMELKRIKISAIKEREDLIVQTESRREAAFSILEKADRSLKSYPPNFDNAIELYLEARNILLEINWEPEISHLDELIYNLRQGKQKFILQQKQEEQIQLQAAAEYERYQQEIVKKKLEEQRAKGEQLNKYREFRLEQETQERFQQEGLALLDVAKKSVSIHRYSIAYEQYEQAIERFKQIGWTEQIKYIKKEIENTQKAEESSKQAQLQVKQAQEALISQKQLEEERRKEEEKGQRESLKDISVLSDDIFESLKRQRKEMEETKMVVAKDLKKDSSSFGKDVGKLLVLKQELMEELKKDEEKKEKDKKALERKKGKNELSDIAKMIRDASKK